MKIIILVLALAQTGCAVYTAASAGSFLATGKTISDHGTSLVTQGDCNATHVFTGLYYCEMPVRYNQSGI